MRNCSVLLLLLALAACTPRARMELNVAQAPDSQLIVRLLDINTFSSSDTVRTDASGRAVYSLPVQAGQPEFVYVFYKDTKIASLLLSEGERVSVKADTLGNYEVQGSPESMLLRDVETAYRRFGTAMDSTSDPAQLSSIFIKHYREDVKYVMEHPRSLTVIPVLFEQLDVYTPVFCQRTDAIIFRSACDSLKAVYPESRYVKSLEKETRRREDALKVQTMVDNASPLGCPELNLPDTRGNRVSLTELDSRVILIHFWDSSDAAQKMFNLDVLMPCWERWHDKGLEIYAVDLNPDKSSWAAVVKAQNLPWINVNDGRGTASSSVMLYNVSAVPTSYLLVDGALSSSSIKGERELERELSSILK